jgi:hypothetical protein
MQNRRAEPRLLCADLVDVVWKDKGGRTRRAVANLEDISLSGACLQVDAAIPAQTNVRLLYPEGELRGRVCYCIYREVGYFVGIEFEPGFRWSLRQFRPQHLLDPRRLLARATAKAIRTTRELFRGGAS